jgi:hypothetical protein
MFACGAEEGRGGAGLYVAHWPHSATEAFSGPQPRAIRWYGEETSRPLSAAQGVGSAA